jgi:very-short-patch-repair endonuclease
LETLTNENKMLKEQRAQLMRSNSTHANTEASKMLTDECFDQLKLKLEAVQDANAELTTAKKRLEDKLS